FLVPIPPFPGLHPSFSWCPSRLFLIPIPAFPAVKPRLDIELCPPQQNWTEGQEGTLNCSAKGTPEPRVNCSKDGHSLIPGSIRPVYRAHAGTYLCQATNELGTAELNVTVWVQRASGAGAPRGSGPLGIFGGFGLLGSS
ncbi:ICAM1 protein, partial [Quiscalus mexicanus]|nr:ICAM1 protein [Quiscalus mexicanus]